MSRLVTWSVIALVLASAAAAQHSDREVYTIDAANSDVHWLVYRAGAFSRLGHNHVISAGELAGRVLVDRDNPGASTFELEIPVAKLVIDDPSLRQGLGEEFSSVPSENDISGTRDNMLSDRVLDGDRFPTLRVVGSGAAKLGVEQTLNVTVELLGRSVELKLPATVQIEADSLEVAGEFELTHGELGMTPFSVMAGALQVGDKMDFSYRIRARRAQ